MITFLVSISVIVMMVMVFVFGFMLFTSLAGNDSSPAPKDDSLHSVNAKIEKTKKESNVAEWAAWFRNARNNPYWTMEVSSFALYDRAAKQEASELVEWEEYYDTTGMKDGGGSC